MNHDRSEFAAGYRDGPARPSRPRKEHGPAIHPFHPHRAWVVVQQPKTEPYRVVFDGFTGRFVTTRDLSSLHARGFDGVFGWVGGLGETPGSGLGAFVLTAADPAPGEVLEVSVHGLRLDDDGGSALLAIDVRATPSHGAVDLHDLPAPVRYLLDTLPAEHEGRTRWLDGPAARDHLRLLHDDLPPDWRRAWVDVDADDWDAEPGKAKLSTRRWRDRQDW